MADNETICFCMNVSREEIVNAIKTKHLKTVEEVGDATEAGTGCGGCRPEIEKILAEING